MNELKRGIVEPAVDAYVVLEFWGKTWLVIFAYLDCVGSKQFFHQAACCHYRYEMQKCYLWMQGTLQEFSIFCLIPF